MAKSARASSIKKNKSGLKKRVFGPVEQARNERLSQKLIELARQPKPEGASRPNHKEDTTMDIDGAPQPRSHTTLKKQKAAKTARIQKKKRTKVTNRIVFKRHAKKPKK